MSSTIRAQLSRSITMSLIALTACLLWSSAKADVFSNGCDYESLQSNYEKTYTGMFVYGPEGDGDTLDSQGMVKIGSNNQDIVLRVIVYDNNRNEVMSDDCHVTPESNCILTWTPKWSGFFSVMVENMSGVSETYRIRFYPALRGERINGCQ